MGKQKFGGVGKGGVKKAGKQSFKFKGKKGNNKFSKKRKNTFDVNARLVIRNLSFKTTEETIKKHFETFGKIAQVTLLKRPNGDLVGCGFIQYEDLENAKQAIATTNSQPFLGRSIEVDWAVPKHQFVPPGYDAKNKKSESKSIDEKVDEHTDEDDEIKEEVVSIKSEEDNEEQNQQKIKSRKNVKLEEDKLDPRVVKKARLIIRNISFKATQESLAKHFAPYGDVLEATLLKKPNGDLVGCGFVQFQNVQAATKAILNTNAKPYLGRPIHVDWAIAKNKYMSFITQQKDEEEYLKNDVKSEPESDDEENKPDVKSENDDEASIKDESDDEDDDDPKDDSDDEAQIDEEDGDEDDDEEVEDENTSQTYEETDPNKLKVSANDAEDGRTIFLKNVPFSVGNEELDEYVRQFGEINYSLVCIDKLTEHSKGTAFVRFQNKEDADIFLSAGPERLTLDGQVLEALPAMFRDRIKGKNSKTKKQPKDSRNLYLIKEGVILANSKAALGVSASDMAKRLSLEQNKSQMLRNLNRFISRYRLTIHNVPPHYADEDLRKVCLEMANVKHYSLKECRVMKHLKGPLDANGKHMSKGYGFVMFTKHEDALACLRRMNNNPSLFDKNNRPIVSFSVEDKVVINARKKRLEKSLIKNPLSKSYVPADNENDGNNSQFNKNNKFSKPLPTGGGRKRKTQPADVEQELAHKRSKFDKKKWNTDQNNQNGNETRRDRNKNDNRDSNMSYGGDYSGETGKPGKTRMRSNFRLRTEAAAHKENVKSEKKQQKAAKRSQDIRKKEKVKQPKQKQNTNKNTKLKKSGQIKDEQSFTDLVNKYKSKLVAGPSSQKVKSKWYEQS